MPVTIRAIESLPVGPFTALGAVRTGDRLILSFPAGTPARALRGAMGVPSELRAVGQSLLATLAKVSTFDAPPPETEFLAGRNVLVAIRNGETAEATRDWLDYHARHHGAEAALILNRDPPGGRFPQDLTDLAPSLPVIIVETDQPLALAAAHDARHPSLAPGAPKRDTPPFDPWHGPFAQLAILELLRHRFLARAGAVMFLNISDVLLADRNGFEAVRAAKGAVLPLVGIECYPWRLRQGAPAPHGDHIALRRGERRRAVSWGAVPGDLPESAVWRPGRLAGVTVSDLEPLQFRRAMGVAFPGVPVNQLVRKSELVEEGVLLKLAQTAFKADPVRLPVQDAIPPRSATNSVTVVTAMRNEGPFILDWIAHNRVIGIAQHLVYTNDCADGTEGLLDALAGAGVTRRDNPFRETGNVPQHAALRAAEDEQVVEDADWLLALDVDEYINVHAGAGRIEDLFAAVPHAHVFSMPWRLFGNADVHAFEDRPVTEQFTRAAPEYAARPLQAWAFKSLYRNAGLFRRMGVHRPKGLNAATQSNLRWIDGAGRDMPPGTWRSGWRMSKATWGYDLVTLNHYAVRSAESFLVKRDRGRANHTDRDQGLAYWFRMNQNAEKEFSIQRHTTAVAAEKARLLTLPGVAEAHEASVDWHRTRVGALRNDPAQAALYDQITSRKLENLSRMATKFGAAVQHYGPDVIPEEIALRDPEEEFFFTVEARG